MPRPVTMKKLKLNGFMRLIRPFKNDTPRCPFHYRGLDAKVGSQETPRLKEKFGLGVQNEARQRLIEFF